MWSRLGGQGWVCSCDSCRYLTSPDHDSRSEVNQDGLVSDIGLDKNIIYIYIQYPLNEVPRSMLQRGTSKSPPEETLFKPELDWLLKDLHFLRVSDLFSGFQVFSVCCFSGFHALYP